MANDLKILDCTLRDGGYINDWRWGYRTARDIIHTLVRANVDIVEVGFLRNVDGYDPDVVIVALGSNGAIRDDAIIQDAVDAVGGRPIYFVTVRNPYPIQDTNNEMLRANAATNRNAGIIDWNGASEGHDDYIVADGTHPTAEGMEVYAKLIRQALVGV